jgi:hypothetical protein
MGSLIDLFNANIISVWTVCLLFQLLLLRVIIPEEAPHMW